MCIVYQTLKEKTALNRLKGIKSIEVILTEKEVNLICDLLNMSTGDWYNKDILPKGIKSVKEANKLTLSLINKIKI